MIGKYFINNIDLWLTWGVFPPDGKSFYASLLKAPERKFAYTKNWIDQNGTQRDLTGVTYANRDLDLSFVMYATSKNAILNQYTLLRNFFISNPNTPFTFKCVDLNRIFTFKYRGMPSFNKLTTFTDNDSIGVEFVLSFTDELPTVYKDKNGATIALTYPPTVPDVPIDLNNYSFEIVNGNVIMSGAGVSAYDISFNGNPISVYGLIPKKGFENELLRLPDAKGLKFESRTLELPFYLHATSEAEFYQRYYSLLGFLLDSRYFNLNYNNLNKRFTLIYSAMPSINQLTLIKGETNIWAELVITCFDDEPTQDGGLGLFDGSFSQINENLIYSQSQFLDAKIGFSLVNGNLIMSRV